MACTWSEILSAKWGYRQQMRHEGFDDLREACFSLEPDSTNARASCRYKMHGSKTRCILRLGDECPKPLKPTSRITGGWTGVLTSFATQLDASNLSKIPWADGGFRRESATCYTICTASQTVNMPATVLVLLLVVGKLDLREPLPPSRTDTAAQPLLKRKLPVWRVGKSLDRF